MRRATSWLIASSLVVLGGCSEVIGIEEAAQRPDSSAGGLGGAGGSNGASGQSGSSSMSAEGGQGGTGFSGAAGEGGASAGSPTAGASGSEIAGSGQAGHGGSAAGTGGSVTDGGAAGTGGGGAGAGGGNVSGSSGQGGATAGSSAAGQGGSEQGGGAGSEQGGSPGCTAPQECPGEDSECQMRTCEGGVCGVAFTAAGVPLSQQNPDDCRVTICDGKGGITEQNDDQDVTADENVCTTEVCQGGTRVSLPIAAKSPCNNAGGKMCDGAGLCVACLAGSDCASGLCEGGVCLDANCKDNLKNGDESDIDCGSGCAPCVVGKTCLQGVDCESGVCQSGKCQAPACTDKVKNGGESDIDCGGSCAKCITGKSCEAPDDCESGVCVGGKCAAPTCTDKVKNSNETDIDCGGTCSGCSNGKSCKVAADCTSGLCVGNVCKAPTCTDGSKNGTETDIDCGGASCKDCQPGQSCKVGSDCTSGVCQNGACTEYVVELGGGQDFTCAVHGGGVLKCWGRNQNGSLGLGDTLSRGENPGQMGDKLPAVDLGAGAKVKAISRGEGFFACAILVDGSVKCWGNNSSGQLGYGDTNNRGDNAGEMGDNLPAVDLGAGHTAKTVALGANHACAILDDDTVKCWGNNSSGQLGYGDTNNRGDNAGEMGDNLPVVNLGAGHTAKAIAAGGVQTCAILENDQVKCWGYGGSGLLLNGKGVDLGGHAGEMGDALPVVDLGAGRVALKLALGHTHTCVLLDNGAVKCNGYNLDGRLGLGDKASHQGEVGDALASIKLGTNRTAKELVAGANHTCAHLDNGALKCWGWGAGGRLGYGDSQLRGGDPGEMGDNLASVSLGGGLVPIKLDAYFAHTCAIFSNDTLKCWGSNTSGTLGLGDGNDRGDEANEMGDNLPFLSF